MFLSISGIIVNTEKINCIEEPVIFLAENKGDEMGYFHINLGNDEKIKIGGTADAVMDQYNSLIKRLQVVELEDDE